MYLRRVSVRGRNEGIRELIPCQCSGAFSIRLGHLLHITSWAKRLFRLANFDHRATLDPRILSARSTAIFPPTSSMSRDAVLLAKLTVGNSKSHTV